MERPELEHAIQPARHLDLVFAASEEENCVDIRSTIIYEVYPKEEYFLVAQTQPPVLKSMVGEVIEATFLWYPTPTATPQRYAFYTTIRSLIDYTLSPGHQTQAIRLDYPKYLYRRNLRFCYRVQPVKEYPINLWVKGYKQTLPVIDISEGGVCFSHPKLPFLMNLKPGEKFRIILDFNEETKMELQVEVIRKFQKKEFPKIAFMGVKFIKLSPNDREFIASVVKKIERIILRKRAGLL
ncbi:MAG: PilZ domain-containing protein [Candidatus Desulfofervidaceae bacterium]|nr:PilZ domain-containing protein [Candidatus Desulfofervidaceae bacterium]